MKSRSRKVESLGVKTVALHLKAETMPLSSKQF